MIGVPLNGIPTAPLLQSGTQFDAARLIWLGSTNREAYVAFVWHSVPIDSIAELAGKDVVVGTTTPGATMTDFPLLLNDILGYRFKIVRGYQGTPQINLAIERGEIQGMGGIGWASVKAQTPSVSFAGASRAQSATRGGQSPAPTLGSSLGLRL